MIDFLDGLDYDDHRSDAEERPSINGDNPDEIPTEYEPVDADQPTGQNSYSLLINAKAYVIADKYDIQALKEWAHRIKRRFGRIPDSNRARFDPAEASIRRCGAVVDLGVCRRLDANPKPPRLRGRCAHWSLDSMAKSLSVPSLPLYDLIRRTRVR
jgi:hypothetical protein